MLKKYLESKLNEASIPEAHRQYFFQLLQEIQQSPDMLQEFYQGALSTTDAGQTFLGSTMELSGDATIDGSTIFMAEGFEEEILNIKPTRKSEVDLNLHIHSAPQPATA